MKPQTNPEVVFSGRGKNTVRLQRARSVATMVLDSLTSSKHRKAELVQRQLANRRSRERSALVSAHKVASYFSEELNDLGVGLKAATKDGGMVTAIGITRAESHGRSSTDWRVRVFDPAGQKTTFEVAVSGSSSDPNNRLGVITHSDTQAYGMDRYSNQAECDALQSVDKAFGALLAAQEIGELTVRTPQNSQSLLVV